MTLYEANQAAYASLPTLRGENLTKEEKCLIEYIDNHKDNYFMFLNHELRYFTLFKFDETMVRHGYRMSREVLGETEFLGRLKAIELSKDRSIVELWITGSDNKCRMYAFFGYDKGVIKV